MSDIPQGKSLMREMKKALPLYCYVNNECRQIILQQGVSISAKKRLEIINLHYMREAGGIMCGIMPYDNGEVLIVSVTQLNFPDTGPIYDKINEYKKARIQWLKEDEERDRKKGRTGRIKCVTIE